MVNPACITAIEQRKTGDISSIFVLVGGKEYLLTYKLDDFLNDLSEIDQDITSDYGKPE